MIDRREMLVGSAAGMWASHRFSRCCFATMPSGELPADSVIVLFLKGGLSHLDSFDPKPEAPVEYRGAYSTIATRLPGVRFTEHLPELAQIADKFALLKTVHHPIRTHDLAVSFMLTGSRSTDAPSSGAIARHFLGKTTPPSYMAIPELTNRAGFLGPSCEACNVHGDSGELIRKSSIAVQSQAAARFRRRRQLLADLDGQLTRVGAVSKATQIRQAAYSQAAELLQSSTMRQVVDLDNEPLSVRRHYGEESWAKQLLLARRLVQAGSRFVTVTLNDAHLGFGSWDTHRQNFSRLANMLPRLDHALATLILDLEQQSLLSRTLVVMLTEFGRTPRCNDEGGRDHWPEAFTTLWAGSGVRAGMVAGETDARGEEIERGDAIAPADVAYTILSKIGIDPRRITNPTNKLPHHHDARFIDQLFA